MKKRGAILQNITSLFIFQGFNYLSPIITLPYLISTLGAERYGVIAFAQAITQYLIVFTEYGFNLTATKEISINRTDSKAVSKIFSSVLLIKLLLTIVCFIALLAGIFLIRQLKEEEIVFLYSFGMVIGQALFPIWLFQGMEKMKYITIVNIVSKAFFVIMVFIVIRAPEDYELVPLINSAGFIVSGLFSLYIAKKEFDIILISPSKSELKMQLQEGWHIFVSSVAISMYRNTNLVILGFISSNLIVGYYSIAEKLTKMVQSIINPVSQALYPLYSKRFSTISKSSAVKSILRLSKYYTAGLLVLTIGYYLFTPFLSTFIEEINFQVIKNIRVLSLIILFGSLNYLIGVVGLVNLGYQKYFSKSVIISGVMNAIFCVLLIQPYQDIGAAISLSLAEFLLFCLLMYKLIILAQNKNESSSSYSHV